MDPKSPTDENLENDVSGEAANLAETNEQQNQTANTDDVAAESSPAKDDKKPESMLDAVKKAIVSGKESSSDSAEGDGETAEAESKTGERKNASEEDEAELGELTEQELKAYRPKTQKRIKHLLTQIDGLKGDAQKLHNISTFCREANLGKQDVDNMFMLAKLTRNEPRKGLEALRALVSTLEQELGETLPPTLEQRVVKGEISHADAQTLSRLEAEQRFTAAQLAQRNAQYAQEQEFRAVEDLKQGVGNSISQWENAWKAKDPDYSAKMPLVQQRIENAIYKHGQMGRGTPTVAEVKQFAEESLRAVNADMKRLMPKRVGVQAVQGAYASTESKPAPQSFLDVVKRGVGR